MFLSLGVRFKADVEALNMVESVGNVTKHRRVPVLIMDKDEYKLIYVPAISGESLAHAYQYNIVQIAKHIYGNKPPLDEWSLRGEFIKFADDNHLTPSLKELVTRFRKNKKAIGEEEYQHSFEKTAIRESITADIGGFLYTAGTPVRRTSPFQVGYAVPVEEAIRQSMIEAQLHTRNVMAGLKAGEQEARAQMLYYIEVASSVYGVTFNIDLDAIGRTSMVRVEDAVDEEERIRRVRIAVQALALTLGERRFGAKLSRIMPVLKVVNAVAALSTPLPFTVSPPQRRDYIQETIRRAEKYVELLGKTGINGRVDILTYNYTGHKQNYSTLEELFSAILDKLGEEH